MTYKYESTINVKEGNGEILNLKNWLKRVMANYVNIKECQVERSNQWSRVGVWN